jgi:hypothetical protein
MIVMYCILSCAVLCNLVIGPCDATGIRSLWLNIAIIIVHNTASVYLYKHKKAKTINTLKWINKWINKLQLINQSTSEWINQWKNDWTNELLNDQIIFKGKNKHQMNIFCALFMYLCSGSAKTMVLAVVYFGLGQTIPQGIVQVGYSPGGVYSDCIGSNIKDN